MLSGVDGDVFKQAFRHEAPAVAAMVEAQRARTLGGVELEAIERWLGKLFGYSRGVRSLSPLSPLLDFLPEREPGTLLFPDLSTPWMAEVHEAMRPHNEENLLDLMLETSARRAISSGVLDRRTVLRDFMWSVMDRGLVSCKGGVLSKLGARATHQFVRNLPAQIEEIVRRAVDKFLKKPGRTTLHLSSHRPKWEPESDIIA